MEFFPQNALGDDADEHVFRVDWYVPHLLSMREQPCSHWLTTVRSCTGYFSSPPFIARLRFA